MSFKTKFLKWIHKGEDDRFGPLDLIKEIIFCLLTMAGSAVWMMLILLILSFIMVSTGIFNIKWMIPVSIATGIGMGIFYVVRTVIKYRRKYNQTS